ncbi:MAG: hypothetical protein AAF337_03955 [Pseudomonadota bacterium]
MANWFRNITLEQADNYCRSAFLASVFFAIIDVIAGSIGISSNGQRSGSLSTYLLDFERMISTALILGAGFAVKHHARFWAILLFAFFIANSVMLAMGHGRFIFIIVSFIFCFFFGRSLVGTVVWHRLNKRSEEVPLRTPIWRKALSALGILVTIILTILIAFGAWSEIRNGPSAAVSFKDNISQKTIEVLDQLELIDEGEEVLAFYSTAVFDLKDEGFILTDRRAIGYRSGDGQVSSRHIAYENIGHIEVLNEGGVTSETVVQIRSLADGKSLILKLSPENDGDEIAIDLLRAKTGKQIIRPQQTVIPRPQD